MSPAVQHSLKDLVENFSPGGCYGIEWELTGDKLKYKSHYNPQWRIDGVKAKGLEGLYTEESKTFEFAVGQGLVGKVFEAQEVLFVGDLQNIDAEGVKDAWFSADRSAFTRAELAAKFDVHSAIFLPSPTGVVEVGSAAQLANLPPFYAPYAGPNTPPLGDGKADPAAIPETGAEPPALLRKMVDELMSAGCYGIQWVFDGEVLKYASHYNPAWRIEAVKKGGLKGLYTTRSMGFTFAKGEGLVGEAFEKQVAIFRQDLQVVDQQEVINTWQGVTAPYLRVDIAREFGIRSALFLPTDEGVLEVGSTEQVGSLEALFTNQEKVAAAGKVPGDIMKALMS